MGYAELSYRVFGSTSKVLKQYFLDTKDDLQHANLGYTLEEWLALAVFTSVLTFVIETITLSVGFAFITSPLVALFLAVTLALSMSGVLFFLFYSYPATLARVRENKIKKALPFSTAYMATIASARVPPITMMKTISQFKEYGEIAQEAGNITRNVEIFGMTFSSALKKQARRTPSREFRELLWGMNTVLAGGGSVAVYLKQKSDELMNDYRRRIRKYAQDLSLFVEIYLTLIITGSIFFIVLSSIIAAISGGLETVVVQTFVVFILLPILSIGFVLLIKAISPLE